MYLINKNIGKIISDAFTANDLMQIYVVKKFSKSLVKGNTA